MFTLLCGASKSLMKALKTFIKPFEAPERSVKIKFAFILILIQLSEMHGVGRVDISSKLVIALEAAYIALSFVFSHYAPSVFNKLFFQKKKLKKCIMKIEVLL